MIGTPETVEATAPEGVTDARTALAIHLHDVWRAVLDGNDYERWLAVADAVAAHTGVAVASAHAANKRLRAEMAELTARLARAERAAPLVADLMGRSGRVLTALEADRRIAGLERRLIAVEAWQRVEADVER